MMERRKSLIALPLNPPPGCYNLSLPILPVLPISNPLRSSDSSLSISSVTAFFFLLASSLASVLHALQLLSSASTFSHLHSHPQHCSFTILLTLVFLTKKHGLLPLTPLSVTYNQVSESSLVFIQVYCSDNK